MLRRAGQGDELIGLRARGELRLRHDHLEQRRGRRVRQSVERVDDHLPAGFGFLGGRRDRFDHLAHPLLLRRARPDHQLARIAAQADPRLRHLRLQHGHRRRGGHALDGVDLDRGDGLGPLGVDLLEDLGDRLVLGRRGPNVQLLRVVRVGGDLGLGHGRGDDLRRGGGRGRPERVDGDLRLLLRRGLLGQLFHELGDLLLLLGAGPGDELAGLRAQHDLGAGDRVVDESADVEGTGRRHPFERVDHDLGVFRALHVDRLERGGDRLVVGRARPNDQLVAFGARGDLRLRHHLLQEGRRRGAGERFERVDPGRARGLALAGRRDFVNERGDLLVVGGPRPDDQLLRVAPQVDPGLGDLGAEHGAHSRGRHSLDRVDLHGGSRGRAFGVDLFEDGGDRLVLVGPRPYGQLLRVVRIERDFGLGHRRGEHFHGGGGRGRLERVDGDPMGLVGRLVGQLVDQAGDLLVHLGRRPGDDLALLGPDGEPCLGNRFAQEARRVDGARSAHAVERVDDRLGLFGLGAFDVDRGQRALDHLVVSRRRPGGQLVGVRARRELGLRHGQLEDFDGAGRLDRFQAVDDRFGPNLVGGPGRHLLQQAGDLAVVRLAAPRQNRARRGVADQLRVGHLLLEHLDRQRRVDIGHRVRGELLFHLGRHAGVHLLDRRLNRLVLALAGPDHQPARLLVEDDLGVGEQTLEHGEHVLRLDRLDGVDAQVKLPGPRRAAGDLVKNPPDDQMLGRLGPHGQLARLAVGDDLDARQVFGQRGQERLEPLALGGRDRVDFQLAGLVGWGLRLELRKRRLDPLLIAGRGHGHQAVVFRVERDLRLGHQLL